MSARREIDTAGEDSSARRQDAPMTAGAEPRIDLERVVWDPEYRDQVLETMKMTG